jgi:hypothetical protein
MATCKKCGEEGLIWAKSEASWYLTKASGDPHSLDCLRGQRKNTHEKIEQESEGKRKVFRRGDRVVMRESIGNFYGTVEATKTITENAANLRYKGGKWSESPEVKGDVLVLVKWDEVVMPTRPSYRKWLNSRTTRLELAT